MLTYGLQRRRHGQPAWKHGRWVTRRGWRETRENFEWVWNCEHAMSVVSWLLGLRGVAAPWASSLKELTIKRPCSGCV
jgi:hypothetical protein